MATGNTFVRFLRCMARVRGDALRACEMARNDYGNDSPVVGLLQKAIVTTGDLGGDAAYWATVNTFLDGVRVFEVMARIDAASPLHTVPVRTRVLSEDTEPVAVWTPEGAIKQASSAAFTQITIDPSKATGLIVVTNDLLKLTTGYAEGALKTSLERSVSRITSAAAFATSDVTGAPPSLLTNATEVTSTGNPRGDLTELLDAFQGDVERAVVVMSSSNAVFLSLQGGDIGGTDTLTVRGGTLAGMPCVASSDVPDSVVAVIDPQRIAYGDDGVRIDTATHADIDVDGGKVSLWQMNLTGFKAERYVSWQPASDAVAYVSGVDWRGNGGGTT